MLSSFLPPVPSLPNDPPEHFPLRKTGEWGGQVRTLQGRVRSLEERESPWGCSRSAHRAFLPDAAFSCLRPEVTGREEGGVGPSNTGAPTVSEPNLKLRYKPKKSLERRKNPLLRKESAPPSLRRRPTETLGGEGQQGGWGGLCGPSGSGPAQTGRLCAVIQAVSNPLSREAD